MSSISGSRDYGRFDELAEEFAERYRRGERPSLQEYVDRLPEMADEIREMFPALVEVERADGEARRDAAPRTTALPRLREVGDYRILREVGRGGMGVVYEAEQISLGRRVALKVLPGHVVNDRKALERFRREAKAAARLHHTNIVPVFEVGRDGDVAFYAMQFIQGQGLDQVIDELSRLQGASPRLHSRLSAGIGNLGATATANPSDSTGSSPPSLRRAAELILSGRLVTEGLDRMPAGGPSAATERFDPEATSDHVAGSASREESLAPAPAPVPADLSRSAVLPGGTHVSELDTSTRRQPLFRSVAQIGRQAAQGLAYAHARGIVHRDIKPSNLLLDTAGVVWITDFGLAKDEDDGLTATGDILGTLRYMAPERFRGEGDARADIYALGLTLYELLALRPAYDASDRLKIIEQVKSEEPVRPKSIDGRIPRDLETIVLKAIDKDPARRYQTAEAMAEDLRRFIADEPIQARRTSATERCWRWARRNPVVAGLGVVLAGVLVLATIGSLLVAGRMAYLAENARRAALAERTAQREAVRQAQSEAAARQEADQANAAAQAETYRAMLSEVKALRAGRQSGWRDDALGNLARLAVMPTPKRSVIELRDEAVACIGEFDIIETARFEGLHSTAQSLDFSPDSTALLMESAGDTIVWDVNRQQSLWQDVDPSAKREPWGIGMLARFLPDGGVVRGTRDYLVEFLDPSGRPSARAPIHRGGARPLNVQVSRRGGVLAIRWDDGRLDFHDADTGARRRSIPGNPFGFGLSPDGKFVAVFSPENAIQIQATDGDDPPVTLGRSPTPIRGLGFSPDGATLAVASGHFATLWDVASRHERVSLRGHKEAVVAHAFSPDGNWVVTASSDYTARIWDARTGQTLSILPGTWFRRAIAFSPDGRFLAVSTSDPKGTVSLYQIRGRRERRWLAGHNAGAQSLSPHPRLPRFASAADDHAVFVWDPESARSLRHWRAHDSFVVVVAYSPDGSLLASGGGAQKEVKLWDAETGALRLVLNGHTAAIARDALAFDPSGRILASGDEGGGLILWDVSTGQIQRRETVGTSPVRSIAFLDEGRRLLVSEERHGGAMTLIDLDGGAPPRRLTLPHGWNRFVVDAPRRRAVVAGMDGGLSVVSLPDLTLSRHIDQAHEGMLWALALSPDGKLLVTGGADRRVILRDGATLEPLLTFPIRTGTVKDLAFDATGRWLAIAGADSDVDLWDLSLVRDELAPLGLAWDQDAPALASAAELAAMAERSRPAVPVITSGTAVPPTIQEARGLVQPGVAAFWQGRHADAAAALRTASDRIATWRKSLPADPVLASLHGISLRFLAASLEILKQPHEARTRYQELLELDESLAAPRPIDLYNTARAFARLSMLEDRGSDPDRESLQAQAVGCLQRAVAADPADIAPRIHGDPDLDSLRDRDDFRALAADAGFPRDPFARPSPLIDLQASPGGQAALRALSEQIAARPDDFNSYLARGEFLARRGAWAAALSDFQTVLQLHPPATWAPSDTILGMKATVVLLRAGDVPGYRRLARAMLDRFAASDYPEVAERTAKVNLLIAPPAASLEPLIELTERAVRLGQGRVVLPWFQMVRGVCAYRAGQFAEAVDWLGKAETSEYGSGFTSLRLAYLAMAEYRLGHEERACSLLSESELTIAIGIVQDDTGGHWYDLQIGEMARREAEALIGPSSSAFARP